MTVLEWNVRLNKALAHACYSIELRVFVLNLVARE